LTQEWKGLAGRGIDETLVTGADVWAQGVEHDGSCLIPGAPSDAGHEGAARDSHEDGLDFIQGWDYNEL